jgi:hypothetical protein
MSVILAIIYVTINDVIMIVAISRYFGWKKEIDSMESLRKK